ncbi:Hypothetical predicted protein [Cloeon dipterum]|uniref:Uncharacterized protein n=1 Tax=Cloeon dipterum TaxID=197152 RepID=A0A8S1E2N2_9INSE|nr:Hypothetical predicted protein [Cloeon dipterum]
MVEKSEDEKEQVVETKETKKEIEFINQGDLIFTLNGKLPGSTVVYFRAFRFVTWPTSTSVRQTYICVEKGCKARIERYKEQPSDDEFVIRLDKWPHTHQRDEEKFIKKLEKQIKDSRPIALPTAKEVELLEESFYVH